MAFNGDLVVDGFDLLEQCLNFGEAFEVAFVLLDLFPHVGLGGFGESAEGSVLVDLQVVLAIFNFPVRPVYLTFDTSGREISKHLFHFDGAKQRQDSGDGDGLDFGG